MTGQQFGDDATGSTERSGTSRRALLRRGSAALAAGLGWVATGPGVVRADTCPHPPSYWRDNPGEWPEFRDDAFFLLMNEDGDGVLRQPNEYQDLLLAHLSEPPGDDVYFRLVKQYIAARLNRRNMPHPDTYDDFWETADSYHRWIRAADRPQTEWVAGDIDGQAIHEYFRKWNHGIGWWCEWKLDPPEVADVRRQ